MSNTSSKTKGKIYQALNLVNGKSYIGQTVSDFRIRKYNHFYDARKRDTPNYKFQRALNKYNVEDWQWNILEKNVPIEELNDREMYYVTKFDSYNNGYNSTIGGGGLIGTAKKHKLFHQDYGWIEMTRDEFVEAYNLNRGALGQVIKGHRPHHKGWCLSEDKRDEPRKKCKKRIMVNPLKSKIGSFKYTVYTIQYKGGTYTGTKVSLSKILGISIERVRQITMDGKRTKNKKCFLISSIDLEKYYVLEPFRKNKKNYYQHYKNLYDSGQIIK